MAATSATSPGTGTTVNQSGYDYSWANATNILTSNNSRASVTVDADIADTSNSLVAKNFGFTIPESDIVSVLVEYECYVTANRAASADHIVALTLDGGTTLHNSAANGLFPLSETYKTYTFTTSLPTYTEINDANFGIVLMVYGGTTSTYYVDHVRVTVTYNEYIYKTFTDTVTAAQVVETYALTSSTFDYHLANNNQAYVYNFKTGGWTFRNNEPFTNVIYRPTRQDLIGARRDVGTLSRLNNGDTFDGTEIASVYRTGFYNLSRIDETKRLEDDLSEAVKKLRSHYSEVKADGNLAMTVYTENDTSGEAITITPATADGITYNQVRTALSRSIRGKYVSIKIANTSGNDFWVGEQRIKVKPRNIK